MKLSTDIEEMREKLNKHYSSLEIETLNQLFTEERKNFAQEAFEVLMQLPKEVIASALAGAISLDIEKGRKHLNILKEIVDSNIAKGNFPL